MVYQIPNVTTQNRKILNINYLVFINVTNNLWEYRFKHSSLRYILIKPYYDNQNVSTVNPVYAGHDGQYCASFGVQCSIRR